PVTDFPPVRQSHTEVDSRIDWERIAATENLPWEAPNEAQSPRTEAAPAESAGVRSVLRRAIRESQCVEIKYKKWGERRPTLRVIEPESFDGGLVRGFCRLRQDDRTFAIDNILEARLTGETFE